MALNIRSARAISTCGLAALFAALVGCSQFGKPEQKPDPNAYPANYKTDLLTYLRDHPDDLSNAQSTYISLPALKQFGAESRYFICLRADGQNWRKEKIAIFFSGMINQFVNATSEDCGTAAYQLFPELLAALSPPSGKK